MVTVLPFVFRAVTGIKSIATRNKCQFVIGDLDEYLFTYSIVVIDDSVFKLSFRHYQAHTFTNSVVTDYFKLAGPC